MRRRSLLLIVLALGLGLSLAWGYSQYSVARQLGINQEGQYQQAFRDMTGHVDNMENFLAKAQGSGSNSNNLIHLTGAWQESNSALGDLSRLPTESTGSTHVSQFLNQVSDFSYVLAQRLAGGENIKPNEEKTLVDMHENARKTALSLHKMQDKIDYEQLSWTGQKPNMWQRATGWVTGTAEASSTDAAKDPVSVSQGLQLLDSQLQKLPPFQYQGRFNSPVSPAPKGLPAKQVSQEQAKKNLDQFLAKVGLKYSLQYAGDAKGLIPTYRFTANGDPNVVVEAGKQGGVPLALTDSRDIGVRSLSQDQAKTKAESYLKALGFSNMYLTAVQDYGSYLTLDYVAQEDGVRIYPDKIVMSIAMDNGRLISYDARAYYLLHHARSIAKTKLSIANARKYLKKSYRVTDTALVILAKDNYAEVLCYEFRGRVGTEEFLSYINASTGFEEQLYRVINTPTGQYLQ